MIRESVSVILLVCVATALSVPTNTNDGVFSVSNALNLFSTNLYKTLAKSKKENLVVSPLSIYMALSMLSYGARNNTANQLKASLHLPQDDSVSKSAFQELVDNLNSTNNSNMRLANKIYTDIKFPVKPDYVSLTQTYFRSAAESFNFTNSEVAPSTINNWTKSHTDNKIKQIIKADDLKNSAMVLLNADYFMREWKIRFRIFQIANRPFYVDANTVKQVPTMLREGIFKYGYNEELEASHIVIPYKGEDLHMVIILPNQVNGLPELEKNLEKIDFYDIVNNTEESTVRLFLPKFQIKYELNLKESLSQLGIDEIFTDNADFSGISDGPLKLSGAVQKAIIEVNFDGDEADHGSETFASSYMVVDRPFFFMIYQLSTRQALFQGHVYEPTLYHRNFFPSQLNVNAKK